MIAEPPAISFVTATYNAATTVAETIASVEREAAAFSYEHLFIDGLSTDGTVDLVRRLKGESAQITSEPDGGVYDAMNKGVLRARGQWIAIINADDFYLPGAVVEMLKAAEANPSAGILHGQIVIRSDGGDRVVTPATGWRGRLGMIHPMCHPAMWARRSTYERYGLYDTRYRIAADQDMFFRFLDNREVCQYVPRPITLMRAGGLSTLCYDNTTLELLDIHTSRGGFTGITAHVLMYKQARTRGHPKTPKGTDYWRWAATDFIKRRMRSVS